MQSREFNPDKPILAWRIFDKVEISKEKKQKVFYNSKRKLTHMELQRLEPIIRALREKWVDVLNREFFNTVKKTHFEIAGGNHTYFFVLPWMLKFFQKKYPHLNVRLTLFEPRTSDDLRFSTPDIISTGSYRDPATGKKLAYVKLLGYSAIKGIYLDKTYFASSIESIRQFGTKKNTLMKHHLIYGRAYTTDERTGEAIVYPYATVPPEREERNRKVLLQQNSLTHIFMKHGVGIFHILHTMERDDSLCKLDETPISLNYRYFLSRDYSQDVRKKGAFVKKTVIALMKNRRKT